MFKAIIFFLITLIIILFPIPIKLTLKYSNKVLEIFIYNKKIKVKTHSNVVQKTIVKINTRNKFFKSFTFSDFKFIIYKYMKLKFKPTITLNTKLEYGFDDAALVAILFGLFHSAYSFLYLTLLNFAKIKKINLKIIPYYEKNDLNMEVLSIIYISLAKIIYMAFIMISCLIKIKHNKANMKEFKGGNVHG